MAESSRLARTSVPTWGAVGGGVRVYERVWTGWDAPWGVEDQARGRAPPPRPRGCSQYTGKAMKKV
eukprot:57184-Chlamydomonas_euryale.AAC.2